MGIYADIRGTPKKILISASTVDHLGEHPHGGCTCRCRYVAIFSQKYPRLIDCPLKYYPPLPSGFFHYNFILTKLAAAQEEAVKVLESMPDPKVDE